MRPPVRRHIHLVHTNPSEAQVNEHVSKVHLLPGLGKSLSPLFAACSTVPPTGLSKSPKNVPNNTGGAHTVDVEGSWSDDH